MCVWAGQTLFLFAVPTYNCAPECDDLHTAMTKKVFIQTHGCQMNEYDSERLFDLLADGDYERSATPEDADLLLLNTCSIRDKAQEKVFDQLGRWKRLKQRRPGIQIGVGGCVASQEGEALRSRAPQVDLIFGPQTLHRVPAMLAERTRSRLPVVDISFPEIEKFDALPDPRVDGPLAFVTVMEGCSKYCSFCVVPYTRGEEVSRPFDDVLAECALLAEKGVREVTLLGQNVNGYRGLTEGGEAVDFAELIHYLAAIDGIERLRFTTSHPLEMTPGLIDAFASEAKLVGHLHLPVQSGSDRILSAMKRNHTVAEYLETIRALKAARPGISISSDFIVGFPGETDADFEHTMDLIDAVGFDHSFSFIYSARPGTPAAQLTDSTPKSVHQARLARLQSRIREQALAISSAMVGTVQTVLVQGPAKRGEGLISGRTENNRVVNFPGSEALVGTLVPVEITAAHPNSLAGKQLEIARP